MNCNFCNKILSSNYSLKTHQNTAKYCLKLQGKIEINNFKCEYCNKLFTRKHHLSDHLNICRYKLEYESKKENERKINIIEELKKEIIKLKDENSELKEQIELYEKEHKMKEEIFKLKGNIEIYEKDHELLCEIAKQPKNVHNTSNRILNINSLDIDKDIVQNVLETSFTEDTILYGQKSLAKFVVNNLLKDDSGNLKYVCTDPSRQIFKFKDSLGEVQKDVKANKLTNILLEGGIKHINSKIAQKSWTNDEGDFDMEKFQALEPKATEINNISNDNSVFVNELTNMTS